MKKKSKKTYLELNKTLDEVDFIAHLIINVMRDTKETFLFLKGEIGTGKTTLVKAIGKYIQEEKEIISPTFNKMFIYNHFIHIDAYNMEGQNLEPFEDYFEDKLVIIEWAEKLNQVFDQGIEIEIQYIDQNQRKYIIRWKE